MNGSDRNYGGYNRTDVLNTTLGLTTSTHRTAAEYDKMYEKYGEMYNQHVKWVPYIYKNAFHLSIPGIKSIVYREMTTTIYWADDTSTTVRCGEDTPYDRYAGFTACVCKKLFGSTTRVKKTMAQYDQALIDARVKEARQKKEAELKRLAERRARRRIKRMAKRKAEEIEAERMAQRAIAEKDGWIPHDFLNKKMNAPEMPSEGE